MRRIIVLAAALCVTLAGRAPAEELKELFYESFENAPARSQVPGVAGKAAKSFKMDCTGKLDIDRGTIAFFYQSEKAPVGDEWAGPGGAGADRYGGYWGMLLSFDLRRTEFAFNLYDIGFYSPPMKFDSIFGRWKAGQWHHLAAVWDREQGITIYEDGRRVSSLWGQYYWHWSGLPGQFSMTGPLDELHIYAAPLTDAQVAQLARGEKPTGAPLPPAPEEVHRRISLERMGWTADQIPLLPVVAPNAPQAILFTRISHAVDAKRPVAYPYEGFLGSTWPSYKYGPSMRGQRLELTLDDNGGYDQVRIFSHRRFNGEIARPTIKGDDPLLPISIPYATFWRGKLPQKIRDRDLTLLRADGQLGQVDFYRVEPLAAAPQNVESFTFAKADAYPDNAVGQALQVETASRDQRPVSGVKQGTEEWTLEAPAFGGFQAVTEAPAEARGYDGVHVTLVAEGITQPTPVQVCVTEPIFPERNWLIADALLQPKGAGRQSYSLLIKGRPVVNMPPVQMRKPLPGKKWSDPIPVPGVGFAFSVTAANPVKWVMGKSGCSAGFTVLDLKRAVPTAVEDQVEWMREAYAENMEGHGYTAPTLVVPMKWLALFAPERMEFRQMYERVDCPVWFEGLKVPKIEFVEPKNDSGAPEWAFWQKVVMDLDRKSVHRIIDHNQTWTGEFGGVWNDDTDHVENWSDEMLCLDGSGKIHAAMERFWSGLYRFHLDDGVGKYAQDPCHYAEEGTSTIGMRNLVEYGDPIAYANAMRSSSHFDKWALQRKDGFWAWKSPWFSLNESWTEGGMGPEEGFWGGHCRDPLVPAGYLIWYNRHPEAVKWYKRFPPMGVFQGGAQAACGTPEEELEYYRKMAPSDKKQKAQGRGEAYEVIDRLGLSDDLRQKLAVPYKPALVVPHYWGSLYTEEVWLNWKVTGDMRFLVDIYKRTAEWYNSHDWLNTDAQPSMDRNPLPRGALVRSRMGAKASSRGGGGSNMWPLHGISYTRGTDDVAALVTLNQDDVFQVRLYPFTEKPLDLQVRLWRLNGTFKAQLAADANDDGKPEETFWEKELKLDRGAYLDLQLPPRKCSILTIRAVKLEPMNFDRPDPAISKHSIELVYGDHLVVKVYNNGTKPVPDCLVRVRDGRSGRVVFAGEQHTGPIEAPLDLKARFKALEFKNINASSWGTVIVELDPDEKVDDMNRHNNRVVYDYRNTFTLHDGWR